MTLRKQKRKVRMHLQDGPSIEGALAARTRHSYVLWAPRILTDDESSQEVSGHVEIPRERVLWWQVLG